MSYHVEASDTVKQLKKNGLIRGTPHCVMDRQLEGSVPRIYWAKAPASQPIRRGRYR